MIRVEKMLFPGTIAGCLFLVLVTSLIARPAAVLSNSLASAPPSMEGAAVNLAAGAANSLAQALPIVTVVPTPLPVQEQVSSDVASSQGVAEGEAQSAVPQEEAQRAAACAVNGGYPEAVRRWCDLIGTYAEKQGLDPNLIAAVMLQESAGNPDAYSKSGAVGLLQVMPRDGLASSFMCVNGPCFSARPSMDELFDPEFNIAYGTRMLSGLVQKHGSVREALFAYGPMNMGYRYADIILDIYNRYQ